MLELWKYLILKFMDKCLEENFKYVKIKLILYFYYVNRVSLLKWVLFTLIRFLKLLWTIYIFLTLASSDANITRWWILFFQLNRKYWLLLLARIILQSFFYKFETIAFYNRFTICMKIKQLRKAFIISRKQHEEKFNKKIWSGLEFT